eukprot:scaffold81895_cov18-Phaeocystis_antarctica.AAC.1
MSARRGQASCTRHLTGRLCARARVRGPRNDTFVLSAEAHQNLGLRFLSSGGEWRAYPATPLT